MERRDLIKIFYRSIGLIGSALPVTPIAASSAKVKRNLDFPFLFYGPPNITVFMLKQGQEKW